PQLTKELVTLRDAALSDDYAYRQVAHLTDNIGPRAVGSPQAKAAVDYVAAELRKVGLEVRLEEVRVPHWMRGIEAAELIVRSEEHPIEFQSLSYHKIRY